MPDAHAFVDASSRALDSAFELRHRSLIACEQTRATQQRARIALIRGLTALVTSDKIASNLAAQRHAGSPGA